MSGSGKGVASVTALGRTWGVSDLLQGWLGDRLQAGCSGECCPQPGEACASATVCAELATEWGPVGGVGIARGGGKTANQSSVTAPLPVSARSFFGTSLSTSISTSKHRQLDPHFATHCIRSCVDLRPAEVVAPIVAT